MAQISWKNLNSVLKFDETFTQDISQTINTVANGMKKKGVSANKEDLTKHSIEKTFIIFYVDDSNTILKPTTLDDSQYKKLCESLANIAIGIKSNGNSQGLETLKSTSGKTLQQIAQHLIKEKTKAKAEEDESLKTKFKALLKNSFKLYKTISQQTFSKFIVTVESKPWGKETLNKLIKIGNQQVEKGDVDIQFPDIKFVFGGSISSGQKHEKQETIA